MKSCKSIEKKLTAYMHGELGPAAFNAVETHLESCEACRSELELQRSTLEMLGEALEMAPAPSELNPWWKIAAKIRTPRKGIVERWHSPRLKAVLVSGAVFSLLFVLSINVVVYQVLQQKEPKHHKDIAVSFESPKPATQVYAAQTPGMEINVRAPGFLEHRVVAHKMKKPTEKMAPPVQDFNTEQYDQLMENAFMLSMESPLSTFSIDVDRAAYANVRRFITGNQLPPPDADRIEEMVNYFDYNYPDPTGEDPFLVSVEVTDCPWNGGHQLALIGLQGVAIKNENLPPNNLVFLLDVSGSMNEPKKLPLLKSAMRLLTEQLRPEDRVSIVVYSGAAGMVLEPTNDKSKILNAIERLEAGGSTAGGEGIELAYKTAKKHFIKEGNNRVILATDGDFNVGASSDGALIRLIEKKRRSDIYLTVLGFGSGNLKDSKMEKLANKGNGNYAYIDDILEAKKVLINEMGSTLVTIAKDVKIQVEFNPKHVKGYRLIGYENRMLSAADFNDDLKDAGELGAGHTVTALYELIPAGSAESIPLAGDLKYQKTTVIDSDDLMTVKLRYKKPNDDFSHIITETIAATDFGKLQEGGNIEFAAAVAEFGLLLRNSEFKGSANYDDVLRRAKAAKGADAEGYRAEFIRMVEKARLLDEKE